MRQLRDAGHLGTPPGARGGQLPGMRFGSSATPPPAGPEGIRDTARRACRDEPGYRAPLREGEVRGNGPMAHGNERVQ